MKYRLTVKGQVAIASLGILTLVAALSFQDAFKADPLKEAEEMTTVAQTLAAPAGTEAQAPTVSDTEPADASQAGSVDASSLKGASARIYFAPDLWEIGATEVSKLEAIAGIAREHPELKIVVEGNINGFPDYNDSEFGEDLSMKRARVVEEVLIGKGIPKEQIEVRWNGSSKPIVQESAEESIWMNRRTDVYIEGFYGLKP